MEDAIMTEKIFIELITAYGAKPENWPYDRRADMLAYCAATPQAEALLGREKMLDGWLDSLLPAPDETLVERLENEMAKALTSAPVSLPQATPPYSRTAFASVAAALAACFVGGFVAAPITLDMLTGGADLLTSLDIISDAFLPVEPL